MIFVFCVDLTPAELLSETNSCVMCELYLCSMFIRIYKCYDIEEISLGYTNKMSSFGLSTGQYCLDPKTIFLLSEKTCLVKSCLSFACLKI